MAPVKEKKYQANYTYAKLKEAYADVIQRNYSIRRAAKLHGMPESTLRFRLKHRDGTEVKSGGPTMFSRQQEEELAQHCVSMCHLGYGFSRWQIMEMAGGMCDVLGKEGKQPSKQWFYGFLDRFPDLKMVKPKKRENSRDIAVTGDMLKTYFEDLKQTLEKYDILNKPQHIWNVDESGITLDHNPPKVLARAGTNPHMVTHGKSATTLIAAVSALGETIPPYIIFKGQRLSADTKSCDIQGTAYRTSTTGWSNSILFLDFFQNHFLKHVQTRPCILLYDGHSTHINVSVIETARENGVHLYVLPPHCSHCLQPLDVSVFSPFKCSLNAQIHKHMHNNLHTVCMADLPGFISTAYKSALTVSTIMSRFRKTGVFPFDPAAPVVPTPTVKRKNESKALTRTERNDNRKVKILFQEKSTEFSSARTEQKTTVEKKKRKAFVPPYGCAITEDAKYNEKKQMQVEGEKEQVKKQPRKRSHSNFTVPFKDNENQEAISGGSAKKAKKQQESVHSESRGKGPRVNSTKGKNPCKRVARKELEDNMSDTIEDNELCVVCSKWQTDGLKLQRSIKFVNWGQCTACTGWVHLKFCTDVESLSENDEFLRPFCARES